MTASALRYMRPLVRAASFVAPSATGRLAFRLFCTPPRPPKRNGNGQSVEQPPAARLRQASRRAIPFPCGSVQAYVFEPETAGPARTILLVHGWTGEAASMTGFVEPLLANGFRVVAFDLPGHGSSTGRELNIPLGVASLAAVARVFGPLHAIVTHSFGGAIALAALAGSVRGQPPVCTERLVLIAAPSSITEITRQFGATIGLGRRGQAALERRIHAVAGNPVEVFEGRLQLEAIGLPTLVIHDRQDRELGFRHAKALAEAGPFVRLEVTDGLGHRRILKARPVAESVARFVVG
ncbi:Alpha/beta fold hydrolase [Hyphomicrobiales bacterium]|nr:Alpha/beta fold hydrolase [Hyphomicrobiales bacterium]CAH1698517.1 Alpha/beta fold hydrolase [Hyphomicrobiales bacterium]CAI0342165.1 Alpha/beta fold hydrolase [Hyphomicrobiales bacterium]